MLNVKIDEAELRTFVAIVVREVLVAIEESRVTSTDRLSYTEIEAARLLGIAKHSLRDARLRGEINGRMAGKKIIYSRRELEKFVAACDGRK